MKVRAIFMKQRKGVILFGRSTYLLRLLYPSRNHWRNHRKS